MAIPRRHLDEEAAEKYSFGKLSSRKTAEIEKHLLICDSCRRKVAESDAYIAAMRQAALKIRKEERTARRLTAKSRRASHSTR